jgi:hypothetical protein
MPEALSIEAILFITYDDIGLCTVNGGPGSHAFARPASRPRSRRAKDLLDYLSDSDIRVAPRKTLVHECYIDLLALALMAHCSRRKLIALILTHLALKN